MLSNFGIPQDTYQRAKGSTDKNTLKPGYVWDFTVSSIGYKAYMNDITASLLLSQLDKLDDVEIVNFLGGEPTLTAAMFTTLKEIRKRNLQHQMEVNIVTNGSLLQRNEDNLLPLLTGFAKVDISISLDVIGDQHDFWRSKNTWKTIEANSNRIYIVQLELLFLGQLHMHQDS